MDLLIAFLLCGVTAALYRTALTAARSPRGARIINHWLLSDMIACGLTGMIAFSAIMLARALAGVWLRPDHIAAATPGLVAAAVLVALWMAWGRLARRRGAAPTI